MLVIVTGISGSGRKEYLNDFVEFAESHRKKVKVYHVGKMLFEQAEKIGVPITAENVLNANPHVLNSLRSAVFENILSTLPKDLKENDAVILSVHSFFYWKKIFSRSYDRFYLRQFNADIFATFIDDPHEVKERLDKREQWKPEKLTVKEILLWQNVEVEVTASWSDMFLKPFFVIPIRQPLSTFYRILFCPRCEIVYVSMPLTHLQGKKDQERVNGFVEELNKYFIVFDPRLVEKTMGIVNLKNKKMSLIFFNQIVNRDLYWLIKQSKKIIAFFPKIVSSPGVINELREGHETNKDTWVVYPGKSGSPFITYFCDRVFSDEKELFKFLKKHYKPFKDHR